MGKPLIAVVLGRGDFKQRNMRSIFLCFPKKNFCEKHSPVGEISVFTLIRTDTTLDLSQKAEKQCL